MRRIMVRYEVKHERLEEHEALVRAVYAELAETKPAGLRYAAYKEATGLGFVHVAFVSVETNPLDASPAFQAFTKNVKDRIQAPPVTVVYTEIGSYEL